MATVGLPLTGAGDAQASVAVDTINGEAFQRVKLFDGTLGSTMPLIGLTSAPNTSDPGLVVRPIGGGSTAVSLSSQITITVGNPTSAVDADLTSVGSTRLVGRVDVNNPTTAVSLSSVHTVTVGNPTTAVEANLSSLGSTRLVGKVDINNPTTAVEANLSSVGSTKLVGKVDVNNPTTVVSLSSAITITVGNPTTSVTVTSGVVLGAGSSANMLGQVQATGTTKVDVTSGVILGAGSSANVLGSVTLTSNTTAITVGSVALLAGTSGNIIGAVAQGPGSSANFWYTQPLPFSSANAARTTVNTSVDVSVIAANANRKGLVIANLSTVQIVALGMSTGAVTTGLTNANLFLSPNSQLTFGYSGGMPLFTGPFRGINISSTAVAGGVAVIEFT